MTDQNDGHGNGAGPIRAFVIGRDRKGRRSARLGRRRPAAPGGGTCDRHGRGRGQAQARPPTPDPQGGQGRLRRRDRGRWRRDGPPGRDGPGRRPRSRSRSSRPAPATCWRATSASRMTPAEAVHTAVAGRRAPDRRRAAERRRQAACLHGRLRCRLRCRRDGSDRQRGKGPLGQVRLPRQRAPRGRQHPQRPARDHPRRRPQTTEAAQVLIANFGRMPAGSQGARRPRGRRHARRLRRPGIGAAAGTAGRLGGAPDHRGRRARRWPGLPRQGAQGPRSRRRRSGASRPTAASSAGRPFTASVRPAALTVMVPRR